MFLLQERVHQLQLWMSITIINEDMVNLFRVLQDKSKTEKLLFLLQVYSLTAGNGICDLKGL